MKPRTISLILIALVSLGLYTLNNDKPLVMNGDNVTVEYIGWLNGGSFKPSNSTFVVGEGKVIKGLEISVVGMKEGEEKNVSIPAALAFGEYDPNKVFEVDNRLFEENYAPIPDVGQMVDLNGVTGYVTSVGDESIVVDTNNEFAGLDFNMTIKVLKVVKYSSK